MDEAQLLRFRHMAITSQLLLTYASQINRAYKRKHVGQVWQEVLAGCVLRVNDDAQGKPLTASSISKQLKIPTENVRRALAQMEKEKAISKVGYSRRSGPAYTISIDYLSDPMVQSAAQAIAEAVIVTAEQLQTLPALRKRLKIRKAVQHSTNLFLSCALYAGTILSAA
jgi:hypothetical protein